MDATRTLHGTANGMPLYRIKDLTKEYQMGEVTVAALRGVSIDIHSGEFLVILGPSGSGKSTLLNIIGGLDRPTAGVALYKDQDLGQFTDRQYTAYRRNHVGFVFQFYNLMPNLTAKENVEMATEISPSPMDPAEALELVGLHERLDHFPSQLSGGEQQRVAIARAIAKRPEVLMCDEPTGALDISTGQIVLKVLNDVNRQLGTTLMVITHNATVGQMADRVIRMADGRVREIITNESRRPVEEIEW